jgi:hypothetical protein
MDFEEFNEGLHSLLGYPDSDSISYGLNKATLETLVLAEEQVNSYLHGNPDHFGALNWLRLIRGHPLYESTEVQDLSQDNSQETLFPFDSASIAGGVLHLTQQEKDPIQDVIDEIVDSYTNVKGCYAVPAFTKKLCYDSKAKENVLKWKCRICKPEVTYTISPTTTSNIQKHVKTTHRDDLYKRLMEKRESGSVLSSRVTQTHMSKKAKVIQFSQKGFQEWLIKYSVLTDQSFLSVEHPVFVGMIDYLKPGISIPSRKVLKKLMMERYDREKEHLKSKLKKVSFN